MARNGRPDSITIYLHTLFNGGVERVIFNLVTSFLQRGIQVDVVLDHLVYTPFKDPIPAGARLIKLGARSIWQRPLKLRNYLRSRRPDVLLSASHFANEIAIISRKLANVNTRIIVSEHASMSTELSYLPWTSPRRTVLPAMIRATYGGADAIVAVSKGVASDTIKLAHPRQEKMHVIYNPLDFTAIRDEALAPVDHAWFEPGAADVILAIGRLERQKNFALLLDAFARVRAERDVRLLILGEGSERNRLEAKIRQMHLEEVVQLPGFLVNPFGYMKRSKVLAMSSSWEGFPLVLIEALILKTPVVATDCPSGPHEALAGGKYGELVAMDDPAALAAALLKTLAGDTKSAPEEWLQQFDMDHVAEKYLSLM